MFQNHAAMFGHIEFFGPIAEHVVDEPRGQFQQELAAQRLQNPLGNRSVPRLAQQLRGGQAGPMRHDRAIQVVQHRTFL